MVVLQNVSKSFNNYNSSLRIMPILIECSFFKEKYLEFGL